MRTLKTMINLLLLISTASLTVYCGNPQAKRSETTSLTSNGATPQEQNFSNQTSQDLGGMLLPPTAELEVSFSSINTHIIQAKCVGCHSAPNPSANISLESYEQIVKHIDLKQPGAGLIMQSISAVDSRIMPPKPFLALSLTEIEVIEEWVSIGAPNN